MTMLSPSCRVTVGICVAKRPSESWLTSAAKGLAFISASTSGCSDILNEAGTYMGITRRRSLMRRDGMRRAFADWPPVLRPPRPYLIITTSNLSADSVAPERQSHFMLDLGAADADVAQQPVVEFAQLASLARTGRTKYEPDLSLVLYRYILASPASKTLDCLDCLPGGDIVVDIVFSQRKHCPHDNLDPRP